MPRTLPVIAQTAIATGWWRRHPAVIITLGTGAVLKYSTINITVGANTFVDRLKYVGPCKTTMTDAPDNVSFDVWNADAVAGLALIDPVNALNGVKASYYQIIVNTITGDADLIEELSGFLEVDSSGGASDDLVTFTLISDTALPTPVIATTQVLPSCPYLYKGELCTYSGTLPTCDKTFDGPVGCAAHFGYEGARDRFGGHSRDLDPVTVANYSSTPAPVAPPSGLTGQALSVYLAAQAAGFTNLTSADVLAAWNTYNDLKMRSSAYGYTYGDFGFDFSTGRPLTANFYKGQFNGYTHF
jgi:hypothetical protein